MASSSRRPALRGGWQLGLAFVLGAVGCASGSDTAGLGPPDSSFAAPHPRDGGTPLDGVPLFVDAASSGHDGGGSGSDATSERVSDGSSSHGDGAPPDAKSSQVDAPQGPVDAGRETSIIDAARDSGTVPDANTPDAPATATIDATIDGTTLTPVSAVAFADGAACGSGGYSVSLFFSGPGLGPQSRFGMCLTGVGTGCTSMQGVDWTPDDGTGDTYNDVESPSCGLVVTELTPGGAVQGSFVGRLTNYSATPVAKLDFDVDFNVPLP